MHALITMDENIENRVDYTSEQVGGLQTCSLRVQSNNTYYNIGML